MEAQQPPQRDNFLETYRQYPDDAEEQWSNNLGQDVPSAFEESMSDRLGSLSDFFHFDPSPAGYSPFAPPSKTSTPRIDTKPLPHGSSALKQPRSVPSSASPESSSQDSSSDSSSRRKHKSPCDPSMKPVKEEGVREGVEDGDWMPTHGNAMHFDDMVDASGYNTATPGLADLSLDNNTMADHFDFESAASSPGMFGDTTDSLSGLTMPRRRTPIMPTSSVSVVHGENNGSGFIIGSASHENSPASSPMPNSQHASPAAMFDHTGAPSAIFGNMPGTASMWNTHTAQNASWPSDFPHRGFGAVEASNRQSSMREIASPSTTSTSDMMAHEILIHPTQAKSRVETQINIRLTLQPMPKGIAKLHLPTHTISKPKLLAKEVAKAPDTLELHTMLVCTSAMEDESLFYRAMRRARGIIDPEPKLVRRRSTGDSEDLLDDDPDSPQNGGEVKICDNCQNRERKRASRKRQKKQEDEEHWLQYQQDRVIVFNTGEYQDWKLPSAPKEAGFEAENMNIREGAMQVELPMRIACYCRHQAEKIGFRVIFTIKDHQDRPIAQAITHSILITDDHKTHPPPTPQHGMPYPDGSHYGNSAYFSAHSGEYDVRASAPFGQRPSYSTSDLQALQQQGGMPFNFQPQPQPQPFTAINSMNSQTSLSSMATPRNLSRNASPTQQAGPNKKRKSSSVHHNKIPSNLTMTQLSMPGSSAGAPATAHTPVTPTSFSPNGITPYIPTSEATFGPSTGIPQYGTSPQNSNLMSAGIHSATMEGVGNMPYYSAPSSRHQSRAPSPLSANRPPAMTYHPHSSHMATPSGSSMHGFNALASFSPEAQMQHQQQQFIPTPTIYKILPHDGPVNGGIEVAIFGRHFSRGLEVMFGDTLATTTTFWDEASMVCMLPPSAGGPGVVSVSVRAPNGARFQSPPMGGPESKFRYNDTEEPQLFEQFARLITSQQQGPESSHRDFARQYINKNNSPWNASFNSMPQGQGQNNYQMGMSQSGNREGMFLKLLEIIDADDSPDIPNFDMRSKTGATLLSLAAGLGYKQVAAGLLARGANYDIRDKGGFTPLMMAAMRGHLDIVTLLIARGADPMMRSRRGYIAADFANDKPNIREALRWIRNHRRTRSLGNGITRNRTNSLVSMPPMWPPPSPSLSGESFPDPSDFTDSSDEETRAPSQSWARSRARSRRNSGMFVMSRRHSLALAENEMRPTIQAPDENPTGFTFPAAAMAAYRDQLSAHIHHFQEMCRSNLPNFQLPDLPNLPNYQAYPMVRRFSSLVPQRTLSRNVAGAEDRLAATDTRWLQWLPNATQPQLTPEPPPAYDDIVARDTLSPPAVKQSGALTAAADALADQKCAEVFDLAETSTTASTVVQGRAQRSLRSEEKVHVKIGKKNLSPEQQEQLRLQHAKNMEKKDFKLYLVYIPIFIVALVFLCGRSASPKFYSKATGFISTLRGTGTNTGNYDTGAVAA
ncbi:hypothetical protein K402DRAFT_246979 [Aulographum hederae CBS 113979]|uniref:IPT/TIG domain-containing protein n=1 Tax=Aulographum hederae CBS 113979 TaxID=1176131 RepID=A0A6G1HAS1_9PEZI|nr:hypothetical protein K402DRAFT_246979 [Aulographum hederae CBS 113979]